MKSLLKQKLPSSWVAVLRRAKRPLLLAKMRHEVRREFRLDARRYLEHMAPADWLIGADARGKHLEAQLTKDYHRVEKGLALKNPKRPFGADVERRLRMLLPQAEPTAPYVDHVSSAIDALAEWNEGGGVDSDVSPVREPRARGIEDAATFFETRHSVRDFSDRPVDPALLHRAVELAINTPSVCNRQAWKIRLFEGADVVRALAFQNGNRGFREQIPALALVTVDTRYFAAASERNQAWIEGGLFSMSFVWALHALGLDSCMLNLSVLNRTAAGLRERFSIEDAELPIMMIAIGHGSEGHRRARSPRRLVEEVLDQPVE
ncbi:nitroreductase family protein [Microbacterium sp. KNMS]